MSKFKGYYLGFTFNDIHSSTFDIVRTSDGSRFNQNLLPTVQDKTLQIPGRPGKVLQSTNYDAKVFQVEYAYDSMTEEKMRKMRQWLGDKKIHPLVFDEMPHKTWYAKVTGNATMKWLVFNEGEGKERIYKGEGTIQFTCYDPFAHCSSKYIPTNEDKTSEWWAGSGLDSADGYWGDESWNSGVPDEYGQIYLYNCGDLESDFTLRLNFTNNKIAAGGLELYPLKTNKKIFWDEMERQENDEFVIINTKNNLVEGYNAQGKKTGNIYDVYITGSYFKLPIGEVTLQPTGFDSIDVGELHFDYLFL